MSGPRFLPASSMFKTILFLMLAASAAASTVTLKNDSEAPRTMEARGASLVVLVEVPALTAIDVEVGEGVFDLNHFCYAFGAGFTLAAPFAAWGMLRKMVREAE